MTGPSLAAETPEVRRAARRLLRCGLAVGNARSRARQTGDAVSLVELSDLRTSCCDARAALSLALGYPPDQIHPARGTWPA